MSGRRYPDQIVVMETRAKGKRVRDAAARYGIPIAEAARIVLDLGLPLFDEEMARRGAEPVPAARKSTRKAVDAEVPPATFRAPAGASV